MPLERVTAMFRVTGAKLIPPEGKNKGWLLTNGLGGFASSTVSGINTRRYHGLLVASIKPPVDRRLLLAKLEEEVFIDEQKYSLFASETVGGYSGRGFDYLHEFRRYPFPVYMFRLKDVFIEKEIIMIKGQNTVLVRYRIINENNRKIRMIVYPLTTSRDYHWTIRRNNWPFFTTISKLQAVIEPYKGAPKLYLATDTGRIEKEGFWYYNVFYEMEALRGLDSVEDLFCPVKFEIQVDGTKTFCIGASTEELDLSSGWAVMQRTREISRMRKLLETARQKDEYLEILILAADDFIVDRETTGKKSIIAGYPWFADWGRDAMISLPGLTLVTGRFEDAREIIGNFITHQEDGLLPNLFPDDAGPPVYNTVDASLWLFWALYKYLEYTGDWDLAREAYACLKQIICCYSMGTKYGIRIDEDGLITQGEDGLALTWMDARVGGMAVTPRHGKPVEINALWHFGLRFMAYLADRFQDVGAAADYRALANRVRLSFIDKFWNSEGQYLYDTISDTSNDASVRCNQIIAVSLPVSLLPRGQEMAIVRRVWQELYTAYGLRTLSPVSEHYRGIYGGSERERDRAYHQGTVWVWPWGHFITAVNRLYSRDDGNRRLLKRMISPLLQHLGDGCVGSVSEIFDGDTPHYSRGCFAQAWSVSEVLRVYAEEILGLRPEFEIKLE